MTNKRIPDLTAATTPLAGTELVPIWDGTTTKRTTVAKILTPAAGNGIDYSAHSSVAGMTSKVLIDYEEGIWTPNQGAGLALVGAFSSGGTYTKVGRQVSFTGFVSGATSVATAAGTQLTGNLPFSASNMAVGTMINSTASTSGGCQISTFNIFTGVAVAATPTIYFSGTYTV